MSLAQLIELFEEQERFFTKTPEGTLELELLGGANESRAVVIKEIEGWAVVQAYLIIPLIPKLDDLVAQAREMYHGHVLIDWLPDEEEEGKAEIVFCCYLLPTAQQSSLDFFLMACNRLSPYLIEVSKRGWWDPKEALQISPFPPEKSELQ